MSEPRESDGSPKEMAEHSDEENEQMEEETPSVISDPLQYQNAHLHEEGKLNSNGSVLVETPVEHNPTENAADSARLPEESQKDTEIPLPDGKDAGEGNKLNEEKLDDGNKLVEAEVEVEADADAKELHSEENGLDQTPLKEEKNEKLAEEKETREDYPEPEHTEAPAESFKFDPFLEGDDDGSEALQAAFMVELENFHKENSLEFKPPKFYGEALNCLKLWRAVTRLGGYDQVTACKLWRQVGESFKPPKTCTTVSWSFRCFYEKALLEYEKHKIRTGELHVPLLALSGPMAVDSPISANTVSVSGRAKRGAAERAMQGWHSQRFFSNGEVGDAIIKDKTSVSLLKRDKHHKNIGALKKKKGSSLEHAVKVSHKKLLKNQVDAMVVDVGQPADWVKINVKRTKDCFEVYALVPGLLREEVHVQSDPAGRLIISGEPEQPDNPWGVTPFKKVVTLPSRIDPHQTSAVVTLHGQLFVRAPFEQPDL
ncbi:uncharacterized protein A4U43_C01F1960 [Asparagus officinalis]|uniref:ARID domain-containing protein n=1 Tax=Asparagus officinalis TaxID=4686 RepID=A0A5P1FQL8_ASPOF|nr:AT-rich interactive domain-containing protein 5-like isoform X1 [Asparagus officinalis]XP_020271046.1 AT-rich interactive domain-containing protein 5-like isoform X2 [Asparagus officinalis]ONK79011.1 uncharacterized protein A4U43_C01F1960 [Asparagus officinalis]